MKEHRTALVTGAGRGVGAAVARQLLIKGFTAYLAVRKRAAGEEAVRRLGAFSGEARVVELDAADEAPVRRAAAAVASQVPRLHALENNAGILEPGDRAEPQSV